MAAGRLPAPGTQYGPCEGSCQHIDCAATRAQAASLCTICGTPIGYEVRFYDTRTRQKFAEHHGIPLRVYAEPERAEPLQVVLDRTTRYWSSDVAAHAACLEAQVD